MNRLEWTAYFRQNARDRRGVSWHEPVDLSHVAARMVGRSVRWLAQVERRDARRLLSWTRSEAGRLLVGEKLESAALLERLMERFGGKRRRFDSGMLCLTGPWSVAAAIARDAVMLRLFGTMRSRLADPVARVVCDQVMHDKKFHIRFLCAWRGLVPRWVWRLLGAWAVLSACWRHVGLLRSLRVPVRDFVRGCWLNLLAVEAAMYAGRDFARDASDQYPEHPCLIRGQ